VVVVVLVSTIPQVTQRAVADQAVAAQAADSLVAAMAEVLEQEQQAKVTTVQAVEQLGIQVAVVVLARQHHKLAAKSAMAV
jgi:hypothetical protein